MLYRTSRTCGARTWRVPVTRNDRTTSFNRFVSTLISRGTLSEAEPVRNFIGSKIPKRFKNNLDNDEIFKDLVNEFLKPKPDGSKAKAPAPNQSTQVLLAF